MERLDTIDHLENWSVSIQLDKKEVARSIHKELNKHTDHFDTQTLISYFLLESRYYTIIGELQASKRSLVIARQYEDNFTEFHRYQHFFAEGIIDYYEELFEEALMKFEKAEQHISSVIDPAGLGEFHLIKAMTYYFLDITALSALHAAKAVEKLNSIGALNFLLARSELVQGMNYMELSDYETAEEYLHRALATCKKIENESLLASTNLNLGLLYVTRELPAVAIRYLEEALEKKQERIELKTLYLLADSYWQTNQTANAMKAYTAGFQKSIDSNNTKMKWEFAMLHKKYEDKVNFESVWQEGIEYFQKINDLFNVRHYSKELAQYYTENKQYELATRYYLLAII
ncbi:lipopolysaccharide assembly protein LapB [Terribacillus sp. DMT04]|uniref:tetratricopeptide repeat protein n=1 Tax=Terribacillus sp. DMT04 TaxID=2850441 RepID=UPI001C2BF421|nr:tetratricopeptide repeat protein [Terribacillus sp. DMT04]QXE02283.1 tetratricopeptide repeat protein [Terribacillus sp. DMT04]